IWNTASTFRVMVRDAKRWKHIARNPFAEIKLGDYLPEKADKKPGWREEAFYELDAVAALTTAGKLQPWRRLRYALDFMTGGRTGEVSELRWSDLTDSFKGGLGRLVISRSYNTRADKVKLTKTGSTKILPVHPYLARLLKEWREAGWREWTGRDPAPE